MLALKFCDVHGVNFQSEKCSGCSGSGAGRDPRSNIHSVLGDYDWIDNLEHSEDPAFNEGNYPEALALDDDELSAINSNDSEYDRYHGPMGETNKVNEDSDPKDHDLDDDSHHGKNTIDQIYTNMVLEMRFFQLSKKQQAENGSSEASLLTPLAGSLRNSRKFPTRNSFSLITLLETDHVTVNESKENRATKSMINDADMQAVHRVAARNKQAKAANNITDSESAVQR
jgi:hypothetical protein